MEYVLWVCDILGRLAFKGPVNQNGENRCENAQGSAKNKRLLPSMKEEGAARLVTIRRRYVLSKDEDKEGMRRK